MTIRVGVIGTGGIGTDHAMKLATIVSGATVSAVTDLDQARAAAVAAAVGGARVLADGFELIGSDEVDAVVIASIGSTHAAFTLACIAAGKPVLCEKPLAPTTTECREVLEAEVALGRRLVIVGFMRRFDPGYRQVKATLASGAIGEPLILHNIHRNAAVPAWFNELDDDDRIDDPRGRHQPLAAGRGDHGGPGDPAEADPERRRGLPGSAVRRVHDRDRDPLDRGVLRQLRVRLRRPLRACRVGGDGLAAEPGRRRADRRGVRDPADCHGLARPLQLGISRRAPGLDQRPPPGRDGRAERMGGLRSHERDRGRRRGRPDRQRIAIDSIAKPDLYA
jgi:hypothetical protein